MTMRTGFQAGVTLIELMIGITVLAILLAVAVPSFVDFRERSITRGAGDELMSFWANARFEAVKRNEFIKVGFVQGAGGMCVGAVTTNDPSDNTACDCMDAAACTLGRFPSEQGEWRGARWLAAPTFGDSDSGVLVIDPKRGILTEFDDQGALTLRSPSDGQDYRLRLVVTGTGKAMLCQPADAPKKIPAFMDRPC